MLMLVMVLLVIFVLGEGVGICGGVVGAVGGVGVGFCGRCCCLFVRSCVCFLV